MNLLRSFLLTLLTVATAASTFAQPAGYATIQNNSTSGLCTSCTVTDPNNAVDGSNATFSQLNIQVGLGPDASIQQRLTFPFIGSVGNEIVLVLGASDTANVAASANIQITTWLGSNQNNDQIQITGSGFTAQGTFKYEYRFPAQFTFDRVEVKLIPPAAGVNANTRIFSASVKEFIVASTLPCSSPNSSTNGVVGTCVGCQVNTPFNAYDGDVDTYSELIINASVPGDAVFQTFLWDDEACGVDSAKIILSAGDGVDLLASNLDPTNPQGDDGAIIVSAVDINGVVIPGSEVSVEKSLLSPTGSQFVYEFIYLPPSSFGGFYGVRVDYGGLALSSSLQLHEICLFRFQPPAPTGGNTVLACYNSIQDLVVTPSPNTEPYWYATANPANLSTDAIYVGSTFNPAANNPGFTFTQDVTYYFYGRNVDENCFSLECDSIVVSVYPEVEDPIQFDISDWCYGTTDFIFPLPSDGIFIMYEDAAGTMLIDSSPPAILVGPILSDTVFYVQKTNEAGCVSENLVPINVFLKEELFFAEFDSIINSCAGEDVTVDITNPIGGVTYNWYTASLGGTKLFTGTSYTFNLTTDTDLYVDAVAIAGGCDSSLFRKRVDINAVPKPTLTANNTFLLVCPGDSVLATALASAGEIVWYDSAVGGSELHRGDTLKLYDNGGTITVYAEATNDRCTSDTRQEYTIVSTTSILADIADLSSSVCNGDSVTITAPAVANVTFTIWDAPLFGTQIGTGNSITINPLAQDTSFYIQIDQANCTEAVSNRAKVTLTMTSPPTIEVVKSKIFACLNDIVTFNIENPNPLYTYRWYNSLGVLVFTGPSFDVQLISDSMMYTAVGAEGLCVNDDEEGIRKVYAYLAEDYLDPTINNGDPILICKGEGVNVTATSSIDDGNNADYYWYTEESGGTLVQTTKTFQLSGPINADITYWLEVVYSNICGDGKSKRVPAFIDVRDKLAKPVVTCGTTTTNSITFTWNFAGGVTDHIINLNGGPDIPAGTQLFYIVDGLSPGESVKFEVRRKGILDCEESDEGFNTCTTKICTFNSQADAPTFEPSLGQICDGEEFTFKITPGDKPIGNYTVIFKNMSSEVSNTFINGDDFKITKNFPDARSYTDPNFDPSDVYTYNLAFKMNDEAGCDVEVNRNLELRVNFTPVVKFVAIATIPSVVGQFINTFTFNNLTSGTYIQNYNYGDGNVETDTLSADGTQEPVVHTYDSEGIYNVLLTVTTADGCTASGTLERPLTVSTVPEIFIPNTFTPNNDLNNDEFKVFGENIELKSLKVYNQYGNEVYRGSGLENGWDGIYEGENQPSGVYAYTAVIADFLGNIYNREGTVTLIRK
ncbi:MAG: gliding motility-associated-like protein [Flavobacteriales bacterium]|jgi:gliding motility-associated-like protein